MHHTRAFTLLLVLLTLGANAVPPPQGRGSGAPGAAAKPRVVITTDPELDDSNSLIRFLLYSTDFRVEGLIYASSGFHWKGDGKRTKWFVPGREYTRFGLKDICPCTSWRWAEGERFIDNAVEAYETAYPNLKVHSSDFPTPAELKSKIRIGNVEFDGDITRDSPGSDLIKSLLLDDEDGPLYLSAWGGHSTIARALKSIKDQYERTPRWAAIREKVNGKVRLLPSGDQDDTYATYIKPNWPEIAFPRGAGGSARLGFGAQNGAPPEDALYLGAEWTKANISSRGPLGALYRVWGDGKQMVKGDIFDHFGFSGLTAEELKAMGYIVWTPVQERGSFISEGDTPTFLNLIDNGLRAIEDDSYGGWGGRRRSVDPVLPGAPGSAAQRNSTGPAQPDFFPAMQLGFAARLKWSVTPTFAGANHEPMVRINGPLSVSARPGGTVRMEGATADPDGNAVSVRWWQYRSAGTYPGEVNISEPASLAIVVRVPADAVSGQTIHLILEGTDNGTPALTRYQRVIVTVR